jgi:hypothetical protein
VFHADWDGLGKRAGFIRNEEVVSYCDVLVAFWDGVSRGTAHAIARARYAGKRVIVHGPDGGPAPEKNLPEPAPLSTAIAAALAARQERKLAAAREAAAARNARPVKEWWDHELGEGSEQPLPHDTVYLPDVL